MRSKFTESFEKVAVFGLMWGGAKALGRGAARLSGNNFNLKKKLTFGDRASAGLVGLGAFDEFSTGHSKLRQAQVRGSSIV